MDISGTGGIPIAPFITLDENEAAQVGDAEKYFVKDQTPEDLKLYFGSKMIREMQPAGKNWSTLGDLVDNEFTFTVYAKTESELDFEADYTFNFKEYKIK